jgi:hypothetical protein
LASFGRHRWFGIAGLPATGGTNLQLTSEF